MGKWKGWINGINGINGEVEWVDKWDKGWINGDGEGGKGG